MTQLNQLLAFFDQICLEDSLYFVVPDAYGRSSFELQWERKAAHQTWKIRKLGSNNWHHATTKNLSEIIHLEKIDVAKLVSELSTNLLTQAVFARTLLSGVEALLGKEKVDEAEKQTQIFVEQLRAMAASHVQSPNGPTSGTLSTPNSPARPMHSLKLIRSSDQNLK